MHKDMLIPDITFILDIPADVAIRRMKKEREMEKEEKEIERECRNEPKFESNIDFLKKLRQRYLEMPKILPNENIYIVNGGKSIREVSKNIIDIFDSDISL